MNAVDQAIRKVESDMKRVLYYSDDRDIEDPVGVAVTEAVAKSLHDLTLDAIREYFGDPKPEPHFHEWEDAVVIERMVGEHEGNPLVLWCLGCGEVKER